jgi:glycosyltransferase involved in cell wall biosynthesis
MNILAVLTAYPPAIGGAQIHTHQVLRLLARGHRVQVASFWERRRTDWLLGTTLMAPLRPRAYEQEGVPVRQIALTLPERLALWPWVLGYYALKPQAIRRIAALLAPQLDALLPVIDIVHCARIGREPLAYAALAVARARRVPFVLAPYHHPRWVGWNYGPLHELYRAADGVLALTGAEREQLAALGVRRERIFVVGAAPNVLPGADGGVFRRRHGLGAGPLVLFIGQKYTYKGWGLLLEAAPAVWTRHPAARFVFIGPRSRASRRAFERQRDGRVLELDTVSEAEKAEALAACTLFCLPSSQESFGMVYAEAWSMGRPVIGLDIPALREVIDDGVDGFRAPPGDAGALADRILALLDDPARAAAMGAAGQQKVRARYTWERVAAATEAVYRALGVESTNLR